jgi:hypothetical protein
MYLDSKFVFGFSSARQVPEIIYNEFSRSTENSQFEKLCNQLTHKIVGMSILEKFIRNI